MMTPELVAIDAIKHMAIYCVLTFALCVSALGALYFNEQSLAALLLCFLLPLPGLAVSKFLEVRLTWQGKLKNTRAENTAALPGVLSLVMTFVAAVGIGFGYFPF